MMLHLFTSVISYTEKFTECNHLAQQKTKTLDQNAVFAQFASDRWCVEIWLHQYDIHDMGVKVDGTYYCYLLLSQQLLPAIPTHVMSLASFYFKKLSPSILVMLCYRTLIFWKVV